ERDIAARINQPASIEKARSTGHWLQPLRGVESLDELLPLATAGANTQRADGGERPQQQPEYQLEHGRVEGIEDPDGLAPQILGARRRPVTKVVHGQRPLAGGVTAQLGQPKQLGGEARVAGLLNLV